MNNKLESNLTKSFNGYSRVIRQIDQYADSVRLGKAFHFNCEKLSLAAGSQYYFSFTTPNSETDYIHLHSFDFASIGNIGKVSIFEDCNFSGGTGVYPVDQAGQINNFAKFLIYNGATVSSTNKNFLSSQAGGGFANQPAGDSVTVVSDNAADTATITIYGTITGATDTITQEDIVLTGDTPVSSIIDSWQNILGIELSESCAGTITISETSGSATITTILTTVLSAGITDITDSFARDQQIWHDADGASTSPLGIIGTSAVDGSVISSVDALNGTTEEVHGTLYFRSVTKVLYGAVGAGVNIDVYILERAIRELISNNIQVFSTKEIILMANTKYTIELDNIGSTDPANLILNLYFTTETDRSISG